MAAIGHARSLGINFFDTAQAYGFGRSERLPAGRWPPTCARPATGGDRHQGRAADGRREPVRDASPGWLRKGAEASLDALGTDYIDLYRCTGPTRNTHRRNGCRAGPNSCVRA